MPVFLNSQDVLEPQAIASWNGAVRADYYTAKLAKRRESIDAFKRERLEDHKKEFRSRQALEDYIQAARDGENMTNTQLEKLSVERNVNLYLLKAKAAMLLISRVISVATTVTTTLFRR